MSAHRRLAVRTAAAGALVLVAVGEPAGAVVVAVVLWALMRLEARP